MQDLDGKVFNNMGLFPVCFTDPSLQPASSFAWVRHVPEMMDPSGATVGSSTITMHCMMSGPKKSRPGSKRIRDCPYLQTGFHVTSR